MPVTQLTPVTDLIAKSRSNVTLIATASLCQSDRAGAPTTFGPPTVPICATVVESSITTVVVLLTENLGAGSAATAKAFTAKAITVPAARPLVAKSSYGKRLLVRRLIL